MSEGEKEKKSTQAVTDMKEEEVDAIGRKRMTHLAKQDISKLVVEELTPLTPEIISRQATINVGTIGHVAHGKSTVVKSLSGVHTVRFRNEMERNITIKLGYANAKIYEKVFKEVEEGQQVEQKEKEKEAVETGEEGTTEEQEEKEGEEQQEERKERKVSKGPGRFTSKGSGFDDTWEDADGSGDKWELRRHISFVDCPGHDILMATMLNGAAVMDAALLLVAGNESCPQPQTSEHLAAVEIMKLKNIIILQNKIDLVKREAAIKQHNEIKSFVSGTVADGAPIIPISAVLKYNIDVICEYLCTKIPIPVRDFTSSPEMIVIRSFDVNKPGEDVLKLKGGVAGGSILKGVLKVGDQIEVRPGIVSKKSDGTIKCTPILSTVLTLYAEQNDLQYAVPGGLIGVGTRIDPTLTRADRLVGQVLGLRGQLPFVYCEVEVSFYLLKRLLGVRTIEGGRAARVSKLSKGEMLLLNIGSTSTGGKVLAMKADLARLQLSQPVCTQEGEKIALSRRVDKHWRLIGWGVIRRGQKIELSLN